MGRRSQLRSPRGDPFESAEPAKAGRGDHRLDIEAMIFGLVRAAVSRGTLIVTAGRPGRDYETLAKVDGVEAVLRAGSDVADPRRQIAILLADPARWAALGARASIRQDERFSTETYVGRLVQFLEETVAIRRAGRPFWSGPVSRPCRDSA